jgi:hypothetical protein
MQITIELPEDIVVRLESKWKYLPRAALESLALVNLFPGAKGGVRRLTAIGPPGTR